ncbi:MAG TPA: CHC2 zinc finger domain-containing protein, partial [Ktedonobacterales bacterium]|nr:CHC2 zinc finger domain-containing protein [Ktedonobacterales bacterium]
MKAISRLTANEIAAIKQGRPIAEVAASYGIRLLPSGSRFVALCPFHHETHPSFTLFPETNRFWCFGCHRGGDTVDLVRLLAGVSFRDALETLASSHGSVTRSTPPPRRGYIPDLSMDRRIDRWTVARHSPDGQRALSVATAFYEEALTANVMAQRYLRARGVSPGVAREARLGYCSGVGLIERLRHERVPLGAAWAVGLLTGRSGVESRERFAGRITIPSIWESGALWLTGRLVDERDAAPRYLCLPGARPLYSVSPLRGLRAVVLVEGYFDALTLAGWNIPACAAGGTTLPPGAARELADSEALEAIYVAFDADPPGQAGARAVAYRLDDRARFVTLPPGVKDVNELGQRRDGFAQFRQCLQCAQPPRQSLADA